MSKQSLHSGADKGKPSKGKSTRGVDPWYKRYPTDYRRGTRQLSLAARGAYTDLLDLMFIEDAGVPNDDMFIACALHCKLREWRAVRKQLFDAGKLFVGEDGLIHNRRADTEIEERSSRRVERASSASRRSENGKKFSVINGGRSTESESDVKEEKDPSSNPIGFKEEEGKRPIQRKVPPSLVDELRSKVGQKRAAELVDEYESRYIAGARSISAAFRGWLRKGGIQITGHGTAAFTPSDALAVCKDELAALGQPVSALPKVVTANADRSWRSKTLGAATRRVIEGAY